MGYSPWGHKESDSTEQIILSLSLFILFFGSEYSRPLDLRFFLVEM